MTNNEIKIAIRNLDSAIVRFDHKKDVDAYCELINLRDELLDKAIAANIQDLNSIEE